MTDGKLLLSQLGVQERARLVVALDHDIRQPQHVIEMGLRHVRATVAEFELLARDHPVLRGLVQRLKGELAGVQIGVRQVVDAQQDLVDAFRLEFDASEPALGSCLASEIISRVVSANRLLAGGIELRAAPSKLEFVSDSRWVERMLNNLVGNAICHSGASKILVGARKRDGGIEFEVRDNGAGIEQERLTNLFAPYSPPSLSPIGRSSARSGLGLYNVRLFCERLGGDVRCTSKANSGTTFRVRLPGPVHDGCSIQSLPRGRSIHDASVALLMNDEIALRVLERKLAAFGIEVYADYDSIRWLSVVTDMQKPPDLLLLDLRLRGADAMRQLDIIRRRWPNSKPNAILLAERSYGVCPVVASAGVPVLRRPISGKGMDYILRRLAKGTPGREVRL